MCASSSSSSAGPDEANVELCTCAFSSYFVFMDDDKNAFDNICNGLKRPGLVTSSRSS